MLKRKLGNAFFHSSANTFPRIHSIKMFNLYTSKVSYSYMSNVKTEISNLNIAELNNKLKSSDKTKKLCNCHNTNSFPLDKNCNVTCIIYQAEITTPESKETYMGPCNKTFKEQYRNYTRSFRNKRYRNVAELSKHIWDVKGRKLNYETNVVKIKTSEILFEYQQKKCNLC